MPVRIKPGVSIRGISPEMSVCIQVVEGFYARKRAGDLWITSCTEGNHRSGSLHYVGSAIDTRIWSISEKLRDQFAKELSEELGDEFDCVLELNHIHIEYQPKGALNV